MMKVTLLLTLQTFKDYVLWIKIQKCFLLIRLVKILDNNLKNYKDKVTIIDRAISSKTSNDALMSADEVFIYNHDLDTYKTGEFQRHWKNLIYLKSLKTDCEGGEWDIFTEENRDYIRNNVKDSR